MHKRIILIILILAAAGMLFLPTSNSTLPIEEDEAGNILIPDRLSCSYIPTQAPSFEGSFHQEITTLYERCMTDWEAFAQEYPSIQSWNVPARLTSDLSLIHILTDPSTTVDWDFRRPYITHELSITHDRLTTRFQQLHDWNEQGRLT